MFMFPRRRLNTGDTTKVSRVRALRRFFSLLSPPAEGGRERESEVMGVTGPVLTA